MRTRLALLQDPPRWLQPPRAAYEMVTFCDTSVPASYIIVSYAVVTCVSTVVRTDSSWFFSGGAYLPFSTALRLSARDAFSRQCASLLEPGASQEPADPNIKIALWLDSGTRDSKKCSVSAENNMKI